MMISIGVPSLEVIEQAFYRGTLRGEDGQPDHDEENPLKKREKKSNDSEAYKEASKDQ